jgi:translation initiation factor IF-3
MYFLIGSGAIITSCSLEAMKHCSRLLSPAQSLLLALTPTQTRAIPKILPRGWRLPISQTRTVYRGANPTGSIYQNRPPPISTYDRLSEFTKDEEIKSQFVCIRGPEGEDRHAPLSEPQVLSTLLRSIDREKQCIILLSKPGTTQFPVVQIAEKEELRRQVRNKERHVRQQQKESKDRKPKQIEMNWAIDGHDLGIKLKQLETFLERGRKVEILLAAKRKGRRAELAEGMELLKQIRARLVELDAKETKTMEGEVLKQATMIVQKKAAG